MKQGPLPRHFDARKACIRELELSGLVGAYELPRVRDLVQREDSTVSCVLRFSRDEQNRFLVRVAIEAEVELRCERCLEAMPWSIDSHSTAMLCNTDAKAEQCPALYEPVMLADETDLDLYELVEEEILLALPAAPLHSFQCAELPRDGSENTIEEIRKPSPFDVLAGLTRGSEEPPMKG
jgi:uncharacterized protein